MSKLLRAAIAAKNDGYTHMYSIVKSVFATVYCHVVPIDAIIEAKQWLPASRHGFGKWHGRVGVTSKNLPTMSINKSVAIKKYIK